MATRGGAAAKRQRIEPLIKRKAWKALPELESQEEPPLDHDSSTNNMIHHYRKLKEAR